MVHAISPPYGFGTIRTAAAILHEQTTLYTSDCLRLGQRNSHSDAAARNDTDAAIAMPVRRALPCGPVGLAIMTTGTAPRNAVNVKVATRHWNWRPRSRR